MFLIENLRVYQVSLEFAEDIIRSLSAKKLGLSRPLADQVIRASTSIAANLAEGNGRWTKRDRKRFFYIARGSLFECLPLLRFLATSGIITAAQEADLRAKANEISKMLNSLIRGTDLKRKSR